ncbi:MAG: hypothetical protein U0T56_03740 [Ferruginibacter sp.]
MPFPQISARPLRKWNAVCINLGFGLEIGSNINGINLGDAFFLSFYQRAEELGCALFIHPLK